MGVRAMHVSERREKVRGVGGRQNTGIGVGALSLAPELEKMGYHMKNIPAPSPRAMGCLGGCVDCNTGVWHLFFSAGVDLRAAIYRIPLAAWCTGNFVRVRVCYSLKLHTSE